MVIASILVSPVFAYDDYNPKVIGEGMKMEEHMGMIQMMMMMMMEHKSEGEQIRNIRKI